MQVGIVGLPNVGKSTLFRALTKKQVDCANYPFCTIEPSHGIVAVPDSRVDALAEISKSEKKIYATVEFVDIAGLVRGASKGEGLGNKFLSHIRECDAVVQVVRAFTDPNIIHVAGKIDPASDIEIINYELIFADLETVNRRLTDLRSRVKSGLTRDLEKLIALVERVKVALEAGKLARAAVNDEEEKTLLRDLHLLTMKPFLYVLNVDEPRTFSFETDTKSDGGSHKTVSPTAEEIDRSSVEKVRGEDALREKNYDASDLPKPIVPLCVKLEAEIAELPPTEAKELLKSYGLEESGLDKLIKKSYETLNLITYLTTGPEETRAWTIRRGLSAREAAGVIHTDFEKGFIAAEIISYEDFIRAGNELKARELGLTRLEGRDYIVKDGDICHFRFNI